MTACTADDHLNLIATVATSDGGIEYLRNDNNAGTAAVQVIDNK